MSKQLEHLWNPPHNSRILFIVTTSPVYVRTQMNKALLEKGNSIQIIESSSKSYFLRHCSSLVQIMKTRRSSYDVVFVSFMSQVLLPFVKLWCRKKIIADAFISLYDTICLDRKYVRAGGFFGRYIRRFERWSLSLADEIVTDTNAYKSFYEKELSMPGSKIWMLYLGAPMEVFSPRHTERSSKAVEVFYYGTGLPLHGTDIILRAADLLRDENIHVTIIGPLQKFGALVSVLNRERCDLIPWVSFNRLADYMAAADICLGGHYGDTPKAGRVIAGKTYQCASMGKAVIIGDTPAVHEIFTNNFDCIMVPTAQPEALAKAIKMLAYDPLLRSRLGMGALRTMQNLREIVYSS